jgi:hypothetical protein
LDLQPPDPSALKTACHCEENTTAISRKFSEAIFRFVFAVFKTINTVWKITSLNTRLFFNRYAGSQCCLIEMAHVARVHNRRGFDMPHPMFDLMLANIIH